MGAAAQPGTTYSAPVTAGAYTIITASEVRLGSGFGSGSRHDHRPTELGEVDHHAPPHTAGGMGGGGGSVGRSVAVIIIGPEGVLVKPIVDITRLLLRGMTILGILIVMLRRVLRSSPDM